MDFFNYVLGEFPRWLAQPRVETAVAAADSEDGFHTVAAEELAGYRPDHVVETGAKTAAGYDGGAGRRGIEEQFFSWAGFLEQQHVVGRSAAEPFEIRWDPHVFR